MYNSSFTCTYNFYDASLALTNPTSRPLFEQNPNFHEEPEPELLEMADYLYKNELLSAFNLEEFDEKLVNSKIQELYITHFVFNDDDEKITEKSNSNMNKMKKTNSKTKLKKIMKKVSEKLFLEDEEFGFLMLFSYSYFHLAHLCLCEFFNTGAIRDELINALNVVIV